MEPTRSPTHKPQVDVKRTPPTSAPRVKVVPGTKSPTVKKKLSINALEQKIKKKLGGKPNKRVNKVLIKHMSPNSVRQAKPTRKELKKVLRRMRQGPTKVVMLTFQASINAFTKGRLNYIRSSLARILSISRRLVGRPTVMAGSVVVRVVLPANAANSLLAMIARGRLRSIGGIGVSKSQVSKNRSKRAPRKTPVFSVGKKVRKLKPGAPAPVPVAPVVAPVVAQPCAQPGLGTTVTTTTTVNGAAAGAAPCPVAAPTKKLLGG